MESYALPRSAEIGGARYAIRSDYRCILDIIGVISDPEINNSERTHVALSLFYPDYASMPVADFDAAIAFLFDFIAGGDRDESAPKPKLMDWEQDFQLIVAPVNRIMGLEVRDLDYLHWWTFLAAYYEIGDCMFAQVVAIRKKRAQGKKLDKADREFYRGNRDIIDLRARTTPDEEAVLGRWVR